MEISINQQRTEIPEHSSVEELLSSLFTDSTQGIALAVNQVIISKSDWPIHILNPDDKITLIKATQGG
ncbi:sulfur carrier protein ThiS [Dyadobacter frigoris]|uniref:Sulfur carrier protein ThiS n=1 Tax=Dyadobacter frigoris TaxID=2576211 RepID=A0A4U6CW37_9BACT|nr:sulfur carrier protein ThiS [Dyadobacter frigoris]TKT88506.1 sulfur carrier protein ThiS [Dyadobacter frigoris]GLU54549.1 thiamine biosynthesis protein ThiS [Dyadobacter frigoris]